MLPISDMILLMLMHHIDHILYYRQLYTRVVNQPGQINVNLSGDHPLLSSIQDKWQVEVWRRPLGQSWNREITGFFRDITWNYDEKSSAVLYCTGILNMLSWRVVNWATGTANRSAFTSDPAETIMKTLVDYNAGPNATVANGRKREGTLSGLSVQADGANGNTENWYCHGDNLLFSLQDLASIGGGDFDLVKTSNTTYEFRWYTGQLGTDRSSTVTFSMEFGNMKKPQFKEERRKEKTVACVWGQGEGAAREYVTRTGANYSANNDIEVYVDARDIDLGDTTGLNVRGDTKVKELEANSSFAFDAYDSPSTRYGIEYFLGDKVTAINPFNGDSHTLKIFQVSVSLEASGEEKIVPEFTSVF